MDTFLPFGVWESIRGYPHALLKPLPRARVASQEYRGSPGSRRLIAAGALSFRPARGGAPLGNFAKTGGSA